MKLRILPSKLKGSVEKVHSKSYTHRLIISFFLSSLTKEYNLYKNQLKHLEKFLAEAGNEDTLASFKVFYSIFNNLKESGFNGFKKVDSIGLVSLEPLDLKDLSLNCNSSATTFRMAATIAILLNIECSFTVTKQLFERVDLDEFLIIDSFIQAYGLYINKEICSQSDEKKFIISINRRPLQKLNKSYEQVFPQEGVWDFTGNKEKTSQVISAIILVSLIFQEDFSFKLIDQGSMQYIDITLDMIKTFGKDFFKEEEIINNRRINKIVIKSKSSASIPTLEKTKISSIIPGDWSLCSNWIFANILMGSDFPTEYPIKIKGLDCEDSQKDKEIISIIDKMQKTSAYNLKFSATETFDICLDNIIDLGPLLIIGSMFFPKGQYKFTGIERLKNKESDRLSSSLEVLKNLGGSYSLAIENNKEYLLTTAPDKVKLQSQNLTSFKDHRMAMILAVISLGLNEEFTLDSAEAVIKSYPKFWEDYKNLGGRIYEN